MRVHTVSEKFTSRSSSHLSETCCDSSADLRVRIRSEIGTICTLGNGHELKTNCVATPAPLPPPPLANARDSLCSQRTPGRAGYMHE
eukprot:6193639-Pleurochrysis_carterae.AAC.2